MMTGYYLKQKEHGKNITDFEFMNEIKDPLFCDNYPESPYDYLHGRCDSFALALSQIYNYETYAIYEQHSIEDEGEANNSLVHVFCIVNSENDYKYYIDIRGITNDFDIFIGEFDDWIIDREEAKMSIKKWNPDNSILENDSLIKQAKRLIKRNNNYYNISIYQENVA